MCLVETARIDDKNKAIHLFVVVFPGILHLLLTTEVPYFKLHIFHAELLSVEANCRHCVCVGLVAVYESPNDGGLACVVEANNNELELYFWL